MSACYSCHAILNKKNQSFEHIIPNSIGGVFKSARLICKECNSAYGMTIDAALAKDFENLAAFLNIGRDRPKSRIIKNTVAPNGDLHHPEERPLPVPIKGIWFDNDQLYISGHDRKQVLQIASGLKRKFPDIDLDSIEKKLQADDELIDEELTISFSVGSDLLMRSVAKIAVNYYLMKVRGRQYLDKIINVINGVEEKGNQIRYYPLSADIWSDGEVSNLIMIKGNNASKRLQAHVILFNTYSLVINLCNDYDGEDIDLFYRYDLLRGQEIKARIDLDDDRNDFLKNDLNQPEKYKEELISSVQHNLERILPIARQQHAKQSPIGVINSTFDKAISGNLLGTAITQEIANDVHGRIFAAVNDFIKRNS